MENTTYIGLSRLSAMRREMDVVANNMANMNSNAYKGERVMFEEFLKGPTAIAYSADPIAAAKVAVLYAKSNDKLTIVGGSMGTQTLSADGIKALATLPSLDELRSKLIALLQTPATRVATVVQAPAAQLARVLGAYARKGEA